MYSNVYKTIKNSNFKKKRIIFCPLFFVSIVTNIRNEIKLFWDMSKFYDIIKNDIPTLVDFYATWCSPCKTMQPALEDLKKHFGEKLRVLKIDVDKNQQLAEQLKIRGVPTFILFKSGEKLWRESGAYSLNQLISMVNPHIM
jgi:thioredoxin 1